MLGVCKSTLYNWHKSGKLVPWVHPLTGGRMYDRRIIEEFIKNAKKKAVEDMEYDLADLKEQLKEKEDKLESSRKIETDLRKQQRKLEEREKELELEVERQLDEEAAVRRKEQQT